MLRAFHYTHTHTDRTVRNAVLPHPDPDPPIPSGGFKNI